MYFPLFADISQKDILIVGGGPVAARRAHTLLAFDARITVITPEATQELRGEEANGRLSLILRAFEEDDLDGRDLVLAATDETALNARIAGSCREKGIPVNVSSDPSLCDFQFPSVVMDEDVVIGINASGKDHGRVKEMRQKLEDVLATPSLYDETKE